MQGEDAVEAYHRVEDILADMAAVAVDHSTVHYMAAYMGLGHIAAVGIPEAGMHHTRKVVAVADTVGNLVAVGEDTRIAAVGNRMDVAVADSC